MDTESTLVTSLDTNVVLRFLLDDVPQQTAAATKLIENEQVYVTDVVVAEVVYVLENAMSLPRRDIVELTRDFLGFENVAHNMYFLLDVIDMYSQCPALSIVDCYAAAEAKAYGNQLASYDKKLINQGGDHVFEP